MFTSSQKEGATQQLAAETFIGPSVKLEGTFSADGDVVVEGTLVGNLSTHGDVRVGPQALIEAQVVANNAHIAGKVKGNLTITGSLKLASTAFIQGDIKTSSISIEDGAHVQGKLSMSQKDKASRPQKREEEVIEKKVKDEDDS